MNKIEFDSTLDDKPIKVTVRKPGVATRDKAKLVSAKAFREAVEAGAFRRRQLAAAVNPEQAARVREVREQLATDARKVPDEKGKVREKGVTADEAKAAAVRMRINRMLLQSLTAEEVSDDSLTAEAIAENAGFDYLVSACCTDPAGKNVFSSLDDYRERANRDEEIANKSASSFAYLDRGIDPEWEKSLPEVKYLESIHFFDGAAAPEEETFDLAEVPAAPPPEAEKPAIPAETPVVPEAPATVPAG